MPLFNPPSGDVTVQMPSVASDNVISSIIAASSNSTLLAASNQARKGFIIVNDSETRNLYLDFGKGADMNDYAVKLTPSAYYELPLNFTGDIEGVWDNDGSGYARIREFE